MSLSSGLVGFWPLNGNADDVASTNHGIPTGLTYAPGLVLPQAGQFNSATPSKVLIPDATPFKLNVFSVSAWVKLTGTGGGVVMACFYGDNPPFIAKGWQFAVTGTGGGATIDMTIFSGPPAPSIYVQSITTVAGINDGNWHHVAATVPGAGAGNIRTYIDSVERTSTGMGFNPYYDNTVIATVGYDLYPGTTVQAPFNGVMGDVAFYNRALSAPEISKLWYGGEGNTYPFLGYGVSPPPNTPPTVSGVSPPGGSSILSNQIIQFDVTDAEELRKVVVTAQLANGDYEVIHDGSVFAPKYAATSTVQALVNGWRFFVRPQSGWVSSPTIKIIAFDAGGLEPA